MFDYKLSYILLLFLKFLSNWTDSQPIECLPCFCHHDNFTLVVHCDDHAVQNINWNTLPHLETFVHFTNSKEAAFHYLPAIWRNLTTIMTLTDVILEDLDLLGYYVIRCLNISHAVISSKAHIINAPLSLKELFITHSNLPEFHISSGNPLSILDLSHNRLTKLPAVSSLRELHFQHNALLSLSVSGGECKPMRNLVYLDVSFNNIAELSDSAFECILVSGDERGHAVHLNFSHNNIRSIHERAFAGLNIAKVDLSQNKLRAISSGILDWYSVPHADFQGNPWQCDCNAQWMLDLLMPHMYNASPALLYNFKCISPNAVKGRSLAYWLHHSNEVFCRHPSAFSYTSAQGTTYELWTGQIIVCIVLAVIIFGLIIAIIAVWVWPKKKPRVRTRAPRPSSNPRYSLVNGPDHDKF